MKGSFLLKYYNWFDGMMSGLIRILFLIFPISFLAMRLDTTQTTISNIESDKNIPNSILLNKLAKELDINMNELFEEKVTNINQIEKIEGSVNLGNGTVNIQSPELIESIMKNQEQTAKQK